MANKPPEDHIRHTPRLLAAVLAVTAILLLQARCSGIPAYDPHSLNGPVGVISTTPAPTWTPNASERIMHSVGIDPASATLEDLVNKLGPPDTAHIGRYGAESTTANVRFFYRSRSLYCYTEWYTPLPGIKRNLRVEACDYFDPDNSPWPQYDSWNGFEDLLLDNLG